MLFSMNDKLKLWNPSTSWAEAEKKWEEGKQLAQSTHPIKTLTTLPQMPGIAERFIKWKSVLYLIFNDPQKVFPRYFFKHPFTYSWRWIRSACKKKSYTRDGDFFLYNIDSVEQFKQQLTEKNTLFVLGFSYCHKPFECPSGRFTSECIHDASHPTCRQCFIGKAMNALPEGPHVPLFIPTIHYIGEQLFELVERHPDKKIYFLITACEMTLEMFGDWGNMLNIHGIGVRLDGRICNTMRAFELSERGIKPGLTVVLDPTQQRMLDIIQVLHDNGACGEKA